MSGTKGINLEVKNSQWKGDEVGYGALHDWVKRRLKKTKFCQRCIRKPPYDLANKGLYTRDLSQWEWLCRKCHMIKDGRYKNALANLARSREVRRKKKRDLFIKNSNHARVLN